MIEGVRRALSSWLGPGLVLPPTRYRTSNVDTAPYGIVSVDPPIFYVAHWMDEELRFASSLDRLFEGLRGRAADFLYAWYWNIDAPERARFVRRFERRHLRRYPRHRFVHLCNTVRQLEVFRDAGLRAVLCSHNALVDERIFRPLEGVPQRFDAVYDARLKRYKRHHLASEVSSLALIYAFSPAIDHDTGEADAIRRALPHAHWFNHEASPAYAALDAAGVNACLNACRVGLCLSAVEGAMYASVQYLLRGMPVVSTRSAGGRDLFFDEDYVAIVDDRPEAVRAGVEALIRRRIPAETIRRRTLEKIAAHRATLVALVQEIYARAGVTRDFTGEWDRVFFDKLCREQDHRAALSLLRAPPRA